MMHIEIGITHEVHIKGDKSWVKLSIADDIETTGPQRRDIDAAIDALAEKVNKKLIDVIEQTVETVTNYQ